MSRATRRREARKGGGSRRHGGPNRAPLWIMSGSVVAALVVLGVIAGRGNGTGHHPEPRADAHSAHVMPASRYANSPGVGEVYQMAAEIPQVLDGMFCYCLCHQNFGHYSLLACFLEDHAAGCNVCLDEAVLAYEMTQRGDQLDAIRAEVDRRYQT